MLKYFRAGLFYEHYVIEVTMNANKINVKKLINKYRNAISLMQGLDSEIKENVLRTRIISDGIDENTTSKDYT